MTPRRNDPCPCGSGRKYKHCCGGSATGDLPPEAARLGSLMRQATRELQRFAMRSVGLEGLLEAWADFWELPIEDLDIEDMDDVETEILEGQHADLFFPWFQLHWRLGEVDAEADPLADTIAGQLLARQGRRLSPQLRAFVDSWRHAPFSFFEVREVWPGRGSLFRDLILERDVFVHDVSSSRVLKRWDLTLAQVVGAGDVYILGAVAPHLLPQQARGGIEDLARSIASAGVTEPEALVDYGHALIAYYHAVEPQVGTEVFAARTPERDPIAATTTRYRFDASSRHELERAMEGLFDRVEAPPDGRTEFLWGEDMDIGMEGARRLLGMLRLGKGELETECMSAERDLRLRAILEDEVGHLLTHVETTVKPFDVEAMARDARLRHAVTNAAPSEPGPEESLEPEIEALRTSFMERAIRDWADESVPFLGGRTPREAAATVEGRKQVAAMIKEWENTVARGGQGDLRVAFDRLRDDLGIEAT